MTRPSHNRNDVGRHRPRWVDEAAIALVYAEAKRVARATGAPQHVDHIIPLHGTHVSGLHVADNLAVLHEKDNLTKARGTRGSTWRSRIPWEADMQCPDCGLRRPMGWFVDCVRHLHFVDWSCRQCRARRSLKRKVLILEESIPIRRPSITANKLLRAWLLTRAPDQG